MKKFQATVAIVFASLAIAPSALALKDRSVIEAKFPKITVADEPIEACERWRLKTNKSRYQLLKQHDRLADLLESNEDAADTRAYAKHQAKKQAAKKRYRKNLARFENCIADAIAS